VIGCKIHVISYSVVLFKLMKQFVDRVAAVYSSELYVYTYLFQFATENI
jgi:hypothetical protein